MLLNDVLQTVSKLSHQDKLRLMHFLLLEVAKEEGCDLESTDNQDQEKALLKQLESTEAVVWSPYEAYEAAQTLSELLTF
jgi:predicted methyltransferase MtxX (methanogen marker protein 4)